MKLFVVRHGFAGDENDNADSERKLKVEGVDVIERLAAWMRTTDNAPSVLITSPCMRARQTAAILQRDLSLSKPIVEDGVGPSKGTALAAVLKKVLANPMAARVAIVSHHDTIAHSLCLLDCLDEDEFVRIAMGELRILKVSRKDGYWTEKKRVLPSSLGGADYF